MIGINENLFLTKDLGEASFLYASGRKLIQLIKEDSRFSFAFDDKTACQKLIDTLWKKEAVVNAKELLDAMRSLKDLIFSR